MTELERQAMGAERFIGVMADHHASVSGPGSLLEQTNEIRQWLPEVWRRFGISSIADIPCGDWFWMAQVDLSAVRYTGYDLCGTVIEANRRNHPGMDFRTFNALAEVPEAADMILARDFFVHLTLDHGMLAIHNFRASGARFLAATTFPGEANRELRESWPGWGWRPLDMSGPPFDLGAPLAICRDGFFADWPTRSIALYSLENR